MPEEETLSKDKGEQKKKTSRRYLWLLMAFFLIGGILVAFKFTDVSSYFQAQVVNKTEEVAVGKDESLPVLSPEQIDFSLNHTAYDPKAITVISNFETVEDTKWQGGGTYDEKVFYEGQRSLGLVSTNRKEVAVTLEKKLDLSSMQYVEFMLHVSDAAAFELVVLDFASLDFKSFYRYSLTNLKNGWNLISIPKDKFVLHKPKESIFDWFEVEKVRFTILSRPDSIFLARVDMLKSINNVDNFIQDWKTMRGKGEMFLSLYEKEGKTKLLARHQETTVATLKEIENQHNFIYSVSISPQFSGKSGLFMRGNYNNGYGYYFMIYGNSNKWQILKKNKNGWMSEEELIGGMVENAVFSPDNEYWLRVEAKGDKMQFYISSDGKEYEKLGELVDGEFKAGGVGITVLDGGWSLFDDFRFKKL